MPYQLGSRNGLLIGRFQPFHLGHLHVLHYPLRSVDKLWIGIGSSNKSNEKENPFSVDERREMITSSLLEDEDLFLGDLELQSDGSLNHVMTDQTIKIFNIPDVDNHEKWTFEIDKIVPAYGVVYTGDKFTKTLFEKRQIRVHTTFPSLYDKRLGISSDEDEQVWNTKKQRWWGEAIGVPQITYDNWKASLHLPEPEWWEDRERFSGTNVRQLIAEDKNWQDLVPRGTRNVLEKINAKERLKNL